MPQIPSVVSGNGETQNSDGAKQSINRLLRNESKVKVS